ncbi:hypothetical protein AAEU29_13180 [Pseudoalteromonas sp. SSM20]|uniref:hypothetical protein n=1 Tax=Pseudoalteromonas sp. SSM20 TaxID=3139394 RepID=UPI003BA94868
MNIKKSLFQIWCFISIMAVLTTYWAISTYMSDFDNFFPIGYERDAWGSLGDFLGGILNPILGFTTILILITTTFIQKKQHEDVIKLTKLDFKENRDQYKREQVISALDKQFLRIQLFLDKEREFEFSKKNIKMKLSDIPLKELGEISSKIQSIHKKEELEHKLNGNEKHLYVMSLQLFQVFLPTEKLLKRLVELNSDQVVVNHYAASILEELNICSQIIKHDKSFEEFVCCLAEVSNGEILVDSAKSMLRYRELFDK